MKKIFQMGFLAVSLFCADFVQAGVISNLRTTFGTNIRISLGQLNAYKKTYYINSSTSCDHRIKGHESWTSYDSCKCCVAKHKYLPMVKKFLEKEKEQGSKSSYDAEERLRIAVKNEYNKDSGIESRHCIDEKKHCRNYLDVNNVDEEIFQEFFYSDIIKQED